MTTKELNYQAVADAMKARQLMAQLDACSKPGQRYLDRDLEAARVKIELRPDFKAILQEVAYISRETMSDYIKVAVQERMLRDLGRRITEGGM